MKTTNLVPSLDRSKTHGIIQTLCLFIMAFRRGNIQGYYAPITQIKSSPRGVNHREFDVTDIGKKTASLDPDRVISEEMAKLDVGGKEPEVTSARHVML